jgi:hypothetical protein
MKPSTHGSSLALSRREAVGASIAAVSVVALAVLGASVATAGGPATTAPGALKAAAPKSVASGPLCVPCSASRTMTVRWRDPRARSRAN